MSNKKINVLVELARKAIENYVREKKIISIPSQLTGEMKSKAGVFVSLKKNGDLRGCIGTFAPTTNNVAEEVIRNAIEAAAADPRFAPVSAKELPEITVSVDVLSQPVRVFSESELDAKKFGVIVKSGMRRGLLLPDLEGVDTPKDQISICRRKAGILENEPVELFKFEVRRFT